MAQNIVGNMRHRIILNNPIRQDNGRGGWSIDYEKGARLTVWAAATLLKVSQRLQYRQDDEAPELVFTIRENPFVKKDTRVLFNGSIYKITDREPNKENSHFMDIRAREV